LHPAACGGQPAGGGDQDQPCDQVGMVDGELLGDGAAGGDAGHGDRPGELPLQGVGVVAGQVPHGGAWGQAGLAVDQVDGELAGQGSSGRRENRRAAPVGLVCSAENPDRTTRGGPWPTAR
jgi:hypothetical protein